MRKTPRGWIQIGESRIRGVARIPLGLKPSRDSRATSQRDSPIWIQPLRVFRYRRKATNIWCLTWLFKLTHWGRDKNGRHFADDTFKRIFLDENIRIAIKTSLKLVPKGPITNIPALVQIMDWRRPGDKPLSETMMVRSLTHICVTWPQWVNTLRPRQNGRHFADDTFKRIFLDENIRISIKISLKFVPKGPINNIPALVQIMAWRRPGDKSLSETMMVRSLTHICVTWPQWVKHFICWNGFNSVLLTSIKFC